MSKETNQIMHATYVYLDFVCSLYCLVRQLILQAMTSDQWCPGGVRHRQGGAVLPFFSRKLEMYLMYKYKICLKCVQVRVGVGGVHL